ACGRSHGVRSALRWSPRARRGCGSRPREPRKKEGTVTRFAILVTAVLASLFRLFGYFNEPRLTDAEIHAIAGEPAGIATARRGLSTTVVSWNIERGVQFQKIATTLQALHPDVVLLQEVDRYCRRSGNHDVARELAHVLGLNWVSAGEF